MLPKKRLFFIFGFFIFALVVLLARLGFIQIFKSSSYLSLAQSQSRAIVEMQPVRGRIVEAQGKDLALDVRLDSLYAVPREMKNKEAAATALSKILGIERSEISRRLARDKMFVWIARKISPAKVEAIKKLKIPEIGFVKESQRVYPKGETACHIVGFTGVDNDGLEGIELQYNSFLKGVPGWRLAQKDAKQRELVAKEIEMTPPVDGYNIHLTIDEVIQSISERILAETCKKYNAKGGVVLVVEPKTGSILAMANYPLYDLNNSKKSNAEIRRNRAITDIYEPGSIFKAITLSAIVENKTFDLNEKFNCENGAWAVAGKVLHDHHGSGVITFREVIEKSSNIGTVKGAMRLGGDKLYAMIKAFGYGQKTGIPLTGEVNGIVPNPRNWSRSTIINIPIGQGVAVTPLQMVYAFAAIANNGVLMRPRIIDYIDDQDGKLVQNFPIEPIRQVISRESAMQVRTVLEGVVARGTGKKAQVPGFRAAGKTGTAQKLMPNGTYSHDHFYASFVGIVPYDDPKIAVLVSLDEPHPIIFGGETAAPAFSRIASEILSYWEVRSTEVPDAVVKKTRIQSPPPAAPSRGLVE